MPTRADLLRDVLRQADEQLGEAVDICTQALRNAQDAVEHFAMLGGSADRAELVAGRIEELRREIGWQIDVVGEVRTSVDEIQSSAAPAKNIAVLAALEPRLREAAKDADAAGDDVGHAIDETLGHLAGSGYADTIAGQLSDLEEHLRRAGDMLGRAEDEATAQRASYQDRSTEPHASQLYVRSLVDRAGWQPPLRSAAVTRLLSSFTHTKIVQRIDAAVTAQESGHLRGLTDWLDFNAEKAGKELMDGTMELEDAVALTHERSPLRARVGREKNAPRGADGLLLPEFDLALETVRGTVQSLVEITTVHRDLERPAQLSRAIDHAAKKVLDRQGSDHPLQGELEALIHITLKVGRTNKKGSSTLRKSTGDIIESRPDGTLIRRRNLYDEIADHIPQTGRHELLSRITLVDQFRHKIVFVREGSKWRRAAS